MIYLCGGISGLTDAQATNWREQAKAWLRPLPTLDPMRRDYRGAEAQNVDAIVRGDLDDISSSSLVLAMCSRPSWGTAMEIFYAHSVGKPVFSIVDTDSPSPWLVHHSERLFRSLSAACAAVLGVVEPA